MEICKRQGRDMMDKCTDIRQGTGHATTSYGVIDITVAAAPRTGTPATTTTASATTAAAAERQRRIINKAAVFSTVDASQAGKAGAGGEAPWG